MLALLIKQVKRKNIKLIHAHDLASLSYAVAVALVCRAKVVMTEHSRHYIDGALRRRVEKMVLARFANQVVEVSGELLNASVHRDGICPDKLMVIENGWILPYFAGPNPFR